MTAHKEDAGTSRRSSLASTGGQPTLFDAEEYESQSRIRNSKLFDSTTVKSFAMYFGDDIRPLVATNSTWQPVDVLILKFSSLRDLHLRMNTDRDPAAANGEDQASDAEPKTPRADRRKSIASFKSLKFARNRSFGSVKSLKGMLDEWRGKSSNSAASEFSVPASVHEAFEQTVVARTQHILAAVDLRELQQEYTTSRSAGSSFVRYVVQHIMEGLTTMPSPISGFLLMGIKELSRTIPRFDSKLKRIINYLNGEAAKEYAKALIFFDFVIAWDTFRDHVNGFVLSNMYFDREGKRKILFGPRRTKIAALVKQLSVEISLRTDFMVLQSHAIPPAQISAAILRAYITWASVNGFIAWTTPDPTYQVLNDIKTMDRIVIPDDGIFEIAMQPEVIACKEMVYTRIGELTAAKYQPVISSRAWARVKGIPTLAYDLREAWEVAESKETWIGYLTELGGRPTKPLPPSTDIIQTDDSDFQIPRWEEAVHQPIPCVNNFGVDTYGTPRRREVYETLSLSMLELLDKKLLASAKFNVDLVKSNDTHPPLILPDYANLLKTLEGIVHEPTPATQWLLSCTAKAETVTGIWELLEGLKHGRYHVWLPVNVAFILSNESLPYTPVSGIASKRGEDLHFFVAQSVPSYAEVVVHLYFKYAYEWSTSRCIVAEGLIRAQESGSSERVIPISRRLCFQVEDSCPSELLSIIRDSDRVLKDVHDNRALKGRERAYLSEVNKYLFQLAEFYLMEESEYVSRQRQALKAYYIPKNLFEKRMLAYINQCTLNFGGDQSLAAAARWVHEELALRPVTEKTTSDDATDSYMLCYVFRAMWKAIQRVAFEDLLIQLQDTNPFFLPESDQVAVSLEMVTSNPNLLAVFGIKSMIMAQEMHPLLRRIAIADMEKRPFVASHPLDAAKDVGGDVENPDAVELAEKNSVEEEDAPGVLITTRSVANSFIYVYFIFLDIALGLTLNSGIFSTFRMQVQVQETISLTLLIMFPIIGGMMNSVGRTVSYYFYQMSMPCMVAAFNRRLVASVIVFIAFGLLCGGITAYRTHDWILAALSWAYAVIFGIFMVLFAGLILLRNPDDYFFRGLGPQAICQACIFLIPNAFICRFVLDDDTNQYVLMSMYIGAMLVATSFMAYSYSTLATAYLEWPNTVTLPSKDEIVETYVRQHPRPVRVETESADAFGRRTRHWERSAAEWFGSQAENTLRKFQINPDPVFRKRLKNWYWEFQLMTWYIKRSGMKEPKVFSSEWDSTAKQAVEELRKKYTVEKLNRGGILFDNEISAIIFGFLYFLMIFSDRWSVLIATGRPLFLLVSTGAQKDYVQGVIGGTVFLLTASGLLELALSSIFAGHKDMKTVPLGSTKGPMEILLGQRRALQSIYATEARRFVMGMFGIWAVISGIMAAVAFSMQRHDLFWNYLLSSAGFVGLLLGLFNKLFVISMEATLSAFLAIGLILGTLISAFMVRHFDRTDYSTFALIISGWLFAIGCIASQALERMQNFYYGLHICECHLSSDWRLRQATHNTLSSAFTHNFRSA
ncbi:uncharacterized protein EV422DRAFT_397445 [Fimicolochytrium jonesii]|uniref:uncharacterized protein n=1 Tax=Fimicolochytrium jonesii TaxID=1396493 RepID=UPI0022FEE5F7|nr:uncharacterized protein EV422DRAFT_397445 [Fimicolochytrium jonesii]KAI8822405.1 hypothetical protein EV422DRAFT_397445 [Fimicolochytrium jonesii]